MKNDIPFKLLAEAILEELCSFESVGASSEFLEDQLKDVFARGKVEGKLQCVKIMEEFIHRG